MAKRTRTGGRAAWLGANVRHLRESRDLSQAALAAEVAKSLDRPFDPTALSRLESGQRSATIDEAVAFAEVLEVPLTDLVQPSEQVSALLAFDECTAEATRAARAIHAATFALLDLQEDLAHHAARLAADHDELREHHGRFVYDESPADIVARAVTEWDKAGDRG